jgi:hypothetical protein
MKADKTPEAFFKNPHRPNPRNRFAAISLSLDSLPVSGNRSQTSFSKRFSKAYLKKSLKRVAAHPQSRLNYPYSFQPPSAL